MLYAQYMIVKNKKETISIYYDKVKSLSIDLGTIGRMSAKPMELVLFGDNNKVLLSVENPSLIMTHLIKSKCFRARISYLNSKKFLWYLGISILIALVISL